MRKNLHEFPKTKEEFVNCYGTPCRLDKYIYCLQCKLIVLHEDGTSELYILTVKEQQMLEKAIGKMFGVTVKFTMFANHTIAYDDGIYFLCYTCPYTRGVYKKEFNPLIKGGKITEYAPLFEEMQK